MEFSIVIPVYNRVGWIERTVQSVYAQTYRPLQLILVDNASTDGSYAQCMELKRQYETSDFMVQVVSEAKPGASASRNRGLREAQGEYVYFFDSDDEMSPTFVSDVVIALQHRSADALVVPTCIVADNGRSFHRNYIPKARVSDQILCAPLSTQAMVLRRDFVQRIGGWSEELLRWNDWELGVRVLLHAASVEWLGNKVYHRIYAHTESITGRTFSRSITALQHACWTVEQDLRRAGTEDALPALGLRFYLLAGTVERERMGVAVGSMLDYAASLVSSPWMRLCGKLLYRYAARGGRGGWRLARVLCIIRCWSKN